MGGRTKRDGHGLREVRLRSRGPRSGLDDVDERVLVHVDDVERDEVDKRDGDRGDDVAVGEESLGRKRLRTRRVGGESQRSRDDEDRGEKQREWGTHDGGVLELPDAENREEQDSNDEGDDLRQRRRQGQHRQDEELIDRGGWRRTVPADFHPSTLPDRPASPRGIRINASAAATRKRPTAWERRGHTRNGSVVKQERKEGRARCPTHIHVGAELPSSRKECQPGRGVLSSGLKSLSLEPGRLDLRPEEDRDDGREADGDDDDKHVVA